MDAVPVLKNQVNTCFMQEWKLMLEAAQSWAHAVSFWLGIAWGGWVVVVVVRAVRSLESQANLLCVC